jgi:hypothetical protein
VYFTFGADLTHGTADAAERNENAEIIWLVASIFPTYAVQHYPASDFSAVSSDFSVFSDLILPPD